MSSEIVQYQADNGQEITVTEQDLWKSSQCS